MKLEELIQQRGLVLQSPNVDQIRDRAQQVETIKIFYGETYDEQGNTIDSLKYYLFVANLAESLKEEGYAVNPIILVADTAAARNVRESLVDRTMQLGEQRAEFVEKVNRTYNADLKVVKMSSYIDLPEFLAARQKIIDIANADAQLLEAVAETVPESVRAQERNKGFLYAFDEITTIIDLDVKIGPPREDLYDKVARDIAERLGAKHLMSLFLTPSLPIGKNWGYFFANEGIQDYGVTAYKGGSKRLQAFRILVGRTMPDMVETLIDDSFISTDPELPNPVLDVAIIAEMAKQRIDGKISPITLANDFYSGRISPNQLKTDAKSNITKYVLNAM